MPEAALRLNDLSASARTPGVQIVANGQLLTRVIEARVHSNNYLAADRFNATVALATDPADSSEDWWQTVPMNVDIRFRVSEAAEHTSIVAGAADLVCYDPIERVVRFEGRDLSSRLIDSPMRDTFTNRTASEIATLLAQRHGLAPLVTPTTTIIGRYYQSEHDIIMLERYSSQMTEWDFLSHLAQQEKFDLYVSGTELHFEPVGGAARPSLRCRPAELIRLRCERSPMLSGPVEVTVRSWSSLEHLAISETASTAQPNDTSVAPVAARRYVILRPNLTPDSARRLAARKLTELRRHDRSIQLVMPGEVSLTPRSTILLYDTNSDFDQTYRIDVIERQFSPSSGFIQLVRAGNIPNATDIVE